MRSLGVLHRYKAGEMLQQIEMRMGNKAHDGAAWSLDHTI
jgi:hypothetical protein